MFFFGLTRFIIKLGEKYLLYFQGEVVKCAFTEMRKFIWNASGQVELNPDEMSAKTSQLSQEVEKMNALASSKRTSPFFNHLSALSDGLPAVGWLTVVGYLFFHLKPLSQSLMP